MSIFEELLNAAKNFQKDLKAKNKIRIITDEELKNLDVSIVKIDYRDGTWDRKSTQFNNIERIIEVSPNYDIEKDLNKNIIHEKCHAILTKEGYANKADILHPYPSNPLEQIAYTTQFYHLLRAGSTPSEIKENSELKFYFQKHPKELNLYLDRAIEEYSKDLQQKQLLKQGMEK